MIEEFSKEIDEKFNTLFDKQWGWVKPPVQKEFKESVKNFYIQGIIDGALLVGEIKTGLPQSKLVKLAMQIFKKIKRS